MGVVLVGATPETKAGQGRVAFGGTLFSSACLHVYWWQLLRFYPFSPCEPLVSFFLDITDDLLPGRLLVCVAIEAARGVVVLDETKELPGLRREGVSLAREGGWQGGGGFVLTSPGLAMMAIPFESLVSSPVSESHLARQTG